MTVMIWFSTGMRDENHLRLAEHARPVRPGSGQLRAQRCLDEQVAIDDQHQRRARQQQRPVPAQVL